MARRQYILVGALLCTFIGVEALTSLPLHSAFIHARSASCQAEILSVCDSSSAGARPLTQSTKDNGPTTPTAGNAAGFFTGTMGPPSTGNAAGFFTGTMGPPSTANSAAFFTGMMGPEKAGVGDEAAESSVAGWPEVGRGAACPWLEAA